MRLFWGSDLVSRTGNAYGYAVHNSALREYVSRVIYLEDNIEDATDIIYILSPEYFNPDKNIKARKWLFTMFEGSTIPDLYFQRMKGADFFLAPSTWVKELFGKYFDGDRVFVVNHGVENTFKYRRRKFPKGKPFRYLYVGAANPRKGYEEVITAWAAAFRGRDDLELYIKTTGLADWRLEFERVSNVILDGRNLSVKELVDLYRSAHCFVFATRGEGFGLTLAEAMRTGLPCIATACTGVTDFFDERVGYEIGYSMGEAEVRFVGDGRIEKTQVAFPNIVQLIEKMIAVYGDYRSALKRGRRASERISSKFTWQNSARKLVEIIEGN